MLLSRIVDKGMGANLSCPRDFEEGVEFTCRKKCPAGFKYAQEGGDTTPIVEKCVFDTNNTYFIELRQIPSLRPDQPETPEFGAERTRVAREFQTLRERIQREAPVQDRISAFRSERDEDIQEYTRIQSEYSNYSSAAAVTSTMKQVLDSLKPMRPPVAGSEINAERKRILETSQPNMLVIQIALAIAVLSLLVYIVMPAEYAHIVVFLLLSVGVAVGIFLKK